MNGKPRSTTQRGATVPRQAARSWRWTGTSRSGVATGIKGWWNAAKRELVGMWVAPSHRGQGVAKTLVARVAQWALSDGAGILTLAVLEGNSRDRRASIRMGLHPTGERFRACNDTSPVVEVLEAAIGDLDPSQSPRPALPPREDRISTARQRLPVLLHHPAGSLGLAALVHVALRRGGAVVVQPHDAVLGRPVVLGRAVGQRG